MFQGEWLRTGDTYVQDADGYYTCLGRTGDMLKASGIWVSPAEVESRLLAHDAVAQAVVVGRARRRRAGEAGRLRRAAGRAARRPRTSCIEFCRAGLPSFKRPRRVVFVDAIPDHRDRQDPPGRAAPMAATVLLELGSLSDVGLPAGRRLMLDGRPLIDVHLHPARLPGLKRAVGRVGAGLRHAASCATLYDDSTAPSSPAAFDAHLAARGRRRRRGARRVQPEGHRHRSRRGHAAAGRAQPGPGQVRANVNPHLHYPVDEELARQLDLGAVALQGAPGARRRSRPTTGAVPGVRDLPGPPASRWSCTAARRRSPAR